MKRIILPYTIVGLLPLIPVIVLYYIFKDQNYFGLEQKEKGLLMLGPIAAYVVLLPILSKLFFRIVKSSYGLQDGTEKLLGDWKLSSKSSNETVYNGKISCKLSNGELVISGTMSFEGDYISQISTIVSKLLDNKLYLIYQMTDKRDDVKSKIGYSKLNIGANFNQMQGDWTVINEDSSGTVEYNKIM